MWQVSLHQPFFFFASFSLLFFCKEDDYECFIRFHFLLSLRDYDKRWRRASWLIIILFFFLGVKNDNELGGLFSSICFFSQMQQMTTSLPNSLSSLFFFPSSSVENDDEPRGLSSFVFFLDVTDDCEHAWLVIIFLFFFSQVQKMMMFCCRLLVFFLKCKR